MNIKQIKDLAQIVKQSGLSALEVVEGESRIRLERSAEGGAAIAPCGAEAALEAAPNVQATGGERAPADDSRIDFNRIFEVKSSLVGVFYAAPAPGAEPFVQVGSRVGKGDVLCVVEAMKLMNEITAERDGEVVDVCVRNGDVVEYGQTLFKLC